MKAKALKGWFESITEGSEYEVVEQLNDQIIVLENSGYRIKLRNDHFEII